MRISSVLQLKGFAARHQGIEGYFLGLALFFFVFVLGGFWVSCAWVLGLWVHLGGLGLFGLV